MRRLLLALLLCAAPVAAQDTISTRTPVTVVPLVDTVQVVDTVWVTVSDTVVIQGGGVIHVCRERERRWYRWSEWTTVACPDVDLPDDEPIEDDEPTQDDEPDEPVILPDPDDDTGGVIAPPSSGTAWYTQDWTSLAGVENSTTGGGDISLISNVVGPGFDRALRVTFFPNAGGEAQAGVTISFPDARRDRPKELWLEYYARWSPNWTVDGPYAGTAGHKHLFLFDQEQTGAGRWEQYVGNNGSSMNLIAGDFGPGGDHAPYPGGIRSLWDGTWKLMRCHARMANSGGTWECWVDGNHFTWGVGDTERKAGLWFQYLALSRNTNKGTDRRMTLDFGPVQVFTSDPGW